MLCERFVYRRTKDQDTMMIAAVGVSLILEYGFMLLFGAQPHVIPPNPLSKVITVGGVSFTGVKLACVLLVAIGRQHSCAVLEPRNPPGWCFSLVPLWRVAQAFYMAALFP